MKSAEAVRRVLFVCTGNICRSPMAEHLARAVASSSSFEFSSAGTYAYPGQPPSDGAITVMDELGIDITGHRSQSVWEVVDNADVLVALAAEHADALHRRLPDRSADIVTLRADGRSVADPYGLTVAAYRATRTEIATAIEVDHPEW
jgi:protein-tyrosine-phosphatase